MADAFVGREAERAYLRQRLEEVRRGHSRVVLVEGPPGIGKTILLRQFLHEMDGPHVLRAAGEELETGLAFGVVEQLFKGVELPGGGSLTAPSADAGPRDVLAVGADILEALCHLQQQGPVALTVDDAQWADVVSLQALTFALRRLRHDRLFVLVLTRDDATDHLPGSLYRLVAAGAGERLQLHGLIAADIRALAAAMGATLSSREAARLHAHTQGSPLHARALLEELSPESMRDNGLPLPAPRSFTTMVLSRLARCSPETERLIMAVAVLGRPSPIQLAARLADIDQPLMALEEAIAARLLEEQDTATERLVAFSQPLVQAAVYGDLGPARRSSLHNRAAALVRSEQAILDHRIAATVGTDAEVATEVATAARRQAMSGAWTAAVHNLRAATRLAPAQGEREEYLLEAVEYMLIGGRTAEASVLEETLLSLNADVRQRYVLGRLALVRGSLCRADALLSEAWQQCDPSVAPELAARIASQFVVLYCMRQDAALSSEWVRRALSAHSATARAEHVTDMLLLTLAISGRCQEGLVLCKGFPDLPDRFHGDSVDGLAGRGILRMWTGDLARARCDLDAAVTAHRRSGGTPAHYLIMVLAALADAEYRLGAWDDALQHGKMAVARAEDTEQRCLMAPCYAVAAFPLAGRGEWEQAQAYTDAATRSALAVGDAVSIAYATSARALVSAARNNPAEVVAAVEPVLLLDASNGITEPGVLPLRELHVNALIDVGEHDRSEPLLGPLEALAQQRGDPALLTVACRLRGSLEAALGHPRKAEAAYQEGLGHAKGCDSLFSRALLEATYGRFLRHSGRRADAAAQLRAAGQRLARLGAQPYLERCNREVEACGRPYTRRHAEDKAGLTPQERAVARLVADGRSNRQVAQELFLSVKTVEFHLRNVFSKLGIRSRSQLVLALLSTSERS